jgi:hypothetical protein
VARTKIQRFLAFDGVLLEDPDIPPLTHQHPIRSLTDGLEHFVFGKVYHAVAGDAVNSHLRQELDCCSEGPINQVVVGVEPGKDQSNAAT